MWVKVPLSGVNSVCFSCLTCCVINVYTPIVYIQTDVLYHKGRFVIGGKRSSLYIVPGGLLSTSMTLTHSGSLWSLCMNKVQIISCFFLVTLLNKVPSSACLCRISTEEWSGFFCWKWPFNHSHTNVSLFSICSIIGCLGWPWPFIYTLCTWPLTHSCLDRCFGFLWRFFSRFLSVVWR